MHDVYPRREQITTDMLSLQADAMFAHAQATEQATGKPGIVQTAQTQGGTIETLHIVVPFGENQVDMTSMSGDNNVASRSRTVRRLDPVVLERTTDDTGTSYRIIADPTYREQGAHEHEYTRWNQTGSHPQKREYGVNRAGRTENIRPLNPDEAQHVMGMLTDGHPYNPSEQVLLQSRKGDKLIKKSVFAGLRRLLAQSGQVTSKWSED